MKHETIIRYEVIAWEDAENPQMPDEQNTFNRKADAMKEARSLAKKYNLVEVNANEVSIYDKNDMWGGELLASWTNGKKTA